MAETLYGLTSSQVLRLKRVLDGWEAGELGQPNTRVPGSLPASRVIVGILTDPISATTALTGKPKVGTLNVYSFSSTGTADTGLDETVYNFAPQAATTDRWAVCERCNITGKWVLTYQACS